MTLLRVRVSVAPTAGLLPACRLMQSRPSCAPSRCIRPLRSSAGGRQTARRGGQLAMVARGSFMAAVLGLLVAIVWNTGNVTGDGSLAAGSVMDVKRHPKADGSGGATRAHAEHTERGGGSDTDSDSERAGNLTASDSDTDETESDSDSDDHFGNYTRATEKLYKGHFKYRRMESFLPLWYCESGVKSRENLLVEVDDWMHGRLMVLASEVSRADGYHFLLHEPMSEQAFFLSRAPDDVGLDVVAPKFSRVRIEPNQTVAGVADEDGLWEGWQRTLRPDSDRFNLTRYACEIANVTAGERDCWNITAAAYAAAEAAANATKATNVTMARVANATAENATVGNATQGKHQHGHVDVDLGNSTSVDIVSIADMLFDHVENYFDDSKWSVDTQELVHVVAHPRNIEVELRVRLEDSDKRSVQIGVHLSLVLLPEATDLMETRVADPRIGFFKSCFQTPGGPAAQPASLASQDRRMCLLSRWRLHCDQLDATSGRCRTSSPITYHLDPSIPKKWQPCFRAGVEAWNRAFHAAGWEGTVVRALDPSMAGWPADYAAGDIRYSSITWAPSLDATYAIGPSNVDPRTGEILNADIMFAESWVQYWLMQWEQMAPAVSRAGGGGGEGERKEASVGVSAADAGSGPGHEGETIRARRLEQQPLPLKERAPERRSRREGPTDVEAEGSYGSGGVDARTMKNNGGLGYDGVHRQPRRAAQCFHHHGPQEHGGSGAAALVALRQAAAHGIWPPSGTATSSDEFICEALTEVSMHEVGHTLGLRHNFAGSAAYSLEQLSNKSFTAEHGVTSSIMDYLPPVLPANRSLQGHYYTPVVGAYDIWAIRYGYTPVDTAENAVHLRGGPPAAPLAAILGETNVSAHHFCTDDDDDTASGRDPTCSVYDLSDDPVAYFHDRLQLAQDIKAGLVARVTDGADGNFAAGLYDALKVLLWRSSLSVAAAGMYAAKHLGGHVLSRAFSSQTAAPLELTSRDQQQRALSLVLRLLTDDELYVTPADYTRLVRSGWSALYWGLEQDDADALGRMPVHVLQEARHIKQRLLDNLFLPSRVVDMQHSAWALAAAGQPALPVHDVVQAVHATVFGDYAAGAPVCSRLLEDVRAGKLLVGDAFSTEQRLLQLTWLDQLIRWAFGGFTKSEMQFASHALLADLKQRTRCLTATPEGMQLLWERLGARPEVRWHLSAIAAKLEAQVSLF